MRQDFGHPNHRVFTLLSASEISDMIATGTSKVTGPFFDVIYIDEPDYVFQHLDKVAFYHEFTANRNQLFIWLG